VIIGALAFAFALVDYSKQFIFVFSAIATVLTGHVVVCSSWLTRLMNHRLLTWIGSRSYGMYLVQAIALKLVERIVPDTNWIGQLVIIFASIAASAGIAELLYRLIEHPCRTFGLRLLASRQPAPSVAATASAAS
jgi:peptidoglycan/LPS O-acetylase OafA/YrhL